MCPESTEKRVIADLFASNLGDGTKVGFFDMKNTRLARVYNSQCLYNKRPAADNASLKVFCEAFNIVMVCGQDKAGFKVTPF